VRSLAADDASRGMVNMSRVIPRRQTLSAVGLAPPDGEDADKAGDDEESRESTLQKQRTWHVSGFSGAKREFEAEPT
jgi:hypothetical protein